MIRRSGWLILPLALLLLTGLLGVLNGLDEMGHAATTSQRFASLTELAYGILGLVGLGALLTDRRWTLPVLLAWGAMLTLTGGMAPAVWGGTGLGPAAAAGVSTALIAAVAIWLAQRAQREDGGGR